MTLPAIRNAIVADMKTRGLGKFVAPHPGRLTTEDLKRVAGRGTSTVLVGCLGIPSIEFSSPGVDFTTLWAAYVLAMDAAGLGRDDAAMLLVAAIGKILPGNVWGLDDVDQPRKIRADNLYNKTAEQRGVALWAVTWRQVWTPAAFALADLDAFVTASVGWDVDGDGEADVTDTVTLPQG